MKYVAFTMQCKWSGEVKGGFLSVLEGKQFDTMLIEFCENTGMQPIGGVSVTPQGTTFLVTQSLVEAVP
jgi:hypothetical protein